mmetsp:Transcript_8520/g.16654  ORF Transcript_8520/g.16654 Transcript_8520/m.16654 type:complete len:89 (+) Transcript_8520:275-541(+)
MDFWEGLSVSWIGRRNGHEQDGRSPTTSSLPVQGTVDRWEGLACLIGFSDLETSTTRRRLIFRFMTIKAETLSYHPAKFRSSLSSSNA